MAVNDKAKELAEAIKATAEFAELRQAKSVIDRDRNLKTGLEAFNKKQTELYNSKLGVKEMEARVAELNKSFSELAKIPEVDKYIKASKKFNDLIGKVYSSINSAVESGLK